MAKRLPPPVRLALDAANLRDPAAFSACFRPNLGCVDDWGRKFYGERDIRGWSERELVAKSASIKVIHFYLVGDSHETMVIAELDRTDFHGPATLTFQLHEDLIETMAITA